MGLPGTQMMACARHAASVTAQPGGYPMNNNESAGGRARRGPGLLTITASALALTAALTATPRSAAAAPQPSLQAMPGTRPTVAGGVGGPGKATTVSLVACGVYVQGGSLYVADGPAVRKITANDQLTTLAGTGVSTGPLAEGGLATGANLNTCGVALDHHGNLV